VFLWISDARHDGGFRTTRIDCSCYYYHAHFFFLRIGRRSRRRVLNRLQSISGISDHVCSKMHGLPYNASHQQVLELKAIIAYMVMQDFKTPKLTNENEISVTNKQ
jgi:hypothetical protein